MFCAKCGAESSQGMKYCEKCGASLQEQVEQMVQENTGRKKNLAIAVVCAGVVLSCIVGILVFVNSQKQAQYNEKIQEATRYYQEMDFERAETAYLEAIDIQPKEKEAYLDLSDIYIQQGRQEEAVELLEKGQKKTGDKEIETKLEKVTADLNQDGSKKQQYQAYYDLCMDYLEKYGDAEHIPYGFDSDQGSITGFSVARLIDFNKDGNMELLLAYSNKGQQTASAFYEVWAWQDNELVNVLPATVGNHGTDVSNWMTGVLIDEMIYLEISRVDDIYESGYLGYDGKEFKEVYEAREDIWNEGLIENSYFIDGKPVSENQYREAVQHVDVDYFIDMDIPYTNDKGEFRIDFWSMTRVYAANLLAETEGIITLLKGKAEGDEDDTDRIY